MTDWLVVLNAALLLTCAAIYFGTGVSLVVFQFPSAGDLHVDNYYPQLVPQVTAATRFFTVMTNVMLVSAGLMVWSEWGTWYLVVPVAEIVLIVLATGLTIRYIFRYNNKLKTGMTDEVEFREVLRRWMRLNVVRSSIWAVEFTMIAAWFVVRSR